MSISQEIAAKVKALGPDYVAKTLARLDAICDSALKSNADGVALRALELRRALGAA